MPQNVLHAENVRKIFYVYTDPAAGTTVLSSKKQFSLNLWRRKNTYELVALDDISIEIYPNELVALLGPSGCGKSTVLRIFAGLETPTAGRVTFKGEAIKEPNPRRAMVFQSERAVFPWLTVEKNIELGPKLQGVPREEREERARKIIDLIQLNGFNKAYPATLSGGMLQRVAVGRALINRPEVLLMDEPFGALDAITRNALQDHLIRIWQETQQTIVFVTHDIDEAIKLGDQVAVFGGGGRLVQLAPPAELLANPKDEFVESLVGRDRGYRRLSFVTAAGLPLEPVATVSMDSSPADIKAAATAADKRWVLGVDGAQRPVSWLDGHHTVDAEVAHVPVGTTYTTADTCRAALDGSLASPAGFAVQVDAEGRVLGGVGHDQIAQYVTTLRSAETETEPTT